MNAVLLENLLSVMAALEGRRTVGRFVSLSGADDAVSAHLVHGEDSAEQLLAWFYLLDEPRIAHRPYDDYVSVDVWGRYHGVPVRAWTAFYTPAERELLTETPGNVEARLSVHRLRRLQILQRTGVAA
ncbi:hypothetical protein [Kutzneria buriramensis]|uniref:Uncharacterized protein n=1 Tax=Kutzneria buriramensis TaxID=1045776 RepID=A0A3E0HEM4_9PSEU|nr:hypothetical protein [Kutzneria buriramensis]REH43613.1 hypothetical protein BCF44_109156 [Kutzneria buriramensis]